MSRGCSNCRYKDLPYDVSPCNMCERCADSNVDRWAIPIEDISDPNEKLQAIVETNMYMWLAMINLHEKLDDLISEIRERHDR